MDIVQLVKPVIAVSVKATHESLGYLSKLVITVILTSLLSIIIPHESYAAEVKEPGPHMVFEVGDHLQYISEIEVQQDEAVFQLKHETAVAKLKRQMQMVGALKDYLTQKRSPLAGYSQIILQQNNWKKIIALSNAESTLCRNYIEATSNCWGVGGSNLWDMGNNLGEGVVAMNNFLNSAPSKSPIKYSQMNFQQMNGLYKQPARDHWVSNNLETYNELTALEKQFK
jgi:hypothetical protein